MFEINRIQGIFLFIFLIIHISCQKKKDSICNHLEITKDFIRGIEVDAILLDKSVKEIEKITGIKSEYDGSPLAYKSPSKQTVLKWQEILNSKGVQCK